MEIEKLSLDEMRRRGYDSSTIARTLAADVRLEEFRRKADDLIKDIKAVFPENIPRPEITRSVARGYDDEYMLSKARFEELAARDPEQKWTDVTDESLKEYGAQFCFLDAEGWLFYLPACMCHNLRNFPGGYDDVYYACKNRTHIELLNEQQLLCTDRFMALCDEYDHGSSGI